MVFQVTKSGADLRSVAEEDADVGAVERCVDEEDAEDEFVLSAASRETFGSWGVLEVEER
jgi:hypothetical protein